MARKYTMLHSCFQEACHSKMFTVYKECIHPLASNLTVGVRFIDDAKQVPNWITHAWKASSKWLH